MKKVLFFVLCFCYSIVVSASEFRLLSTLEGLSQNDVNCIFQDSKGFIWIGTNDGLNRYDGYEFKTFRREPREENGIAGNIIQAITEDSNGDIWIGTNDNGVSKFDLSANKFVTYANAPGGVKLLQSNRVTKITADDKGNVWVVNAKGIDIINIETNDIYSVSKEGLYHRKDEMPFNYIKDVFVDKSGTVWAATTYGLRQINPYTYKIEASLIGKRGHRVVAGICEFNDKLYVYNSKGVGYLDRESKTFEYILNSERISQLEFDLEGNIWAGTSDGLIVVSLKRKSPLVYEVEKIYRDGIEQGGGITSNLIKDIYRDKSGLIWVGTTGGGVNIYNPEHKRFKHYKKTRKESSISYNKIRAVHEDQHGGLWIGTDGGGVNYLPKQTKKDYSKGFIHKYSNENTKASNGYCIAEDTLNNRIWVGTGYPIKIKVYSSKTGKEINIDKWNLEVIKSVFSILIDSEGCVWLGSYGDGLWRLKPDGSGGYMQDNFMFDSKSYALPSDFIRSILEDKKGNIWVGTTEGLVKIKAKHKYLDKPKFFTYKNIVNDPKSISHDYILPIFQSRNKDIWIGTLGGGLNRYRETKDGIGYFTTYTTKDGLPNNVVKSILEDDKGNLWLATNRGITKFNIKSKEVFNYDINDGLQDYEFAELACAKRKNGEMIFGGVNGFNTFFPNQIVEDNSESPVVFTKLSILNQFVEVGEELRGRILLENDINDTEELHLKYSENSFSIHYVGLNFIAPQKNKYKYKLEGFDEEWIETASDTRFAKYTNLKPGTYKLRVTASNSDGQWSDKERAISVVVIAPWWLSTWALVAYCLVIVILLIFFRRFSLIGIQQKNQLLMERFEKEKVEELSQLKLKFFTNVSHEFRTPLTLIIGPIEKLIREKSAMSAEKMAQVHDIIHRNANVLLRLINQLMDFRKFEQGKMTIKAEKHNLVEFVRNIYSSFEIFAEQKGIDFSIQCFTEDIEVWIDTEKMEKIIYNLLSNAFKFTPSGGKITIQVKESGSEIFFSVEDSGEGMDEDMKARVFERFYQGDKLENKKYGSTGIGLAYTKGLVEMHHGSIDVASELNEGTTFTVTLLKGNAHYQKEELQLESEYRSVADSVWVNSLDPNDSSTVVVDTEDDVDSDSPKTILIVEDNVELRSFVKESLSGIYKVIEAENGEAGLELCKEQNPDIIVSDVMMPKMDGFEMCKAIKDDVAVSHTPIILLTAKTSSEHKIKGYSLGADAYVSKPFNFEVLKAQIENLLAKRENLKGAFHKKVDVSPTEVATTSMDEKFLTKILSIIEDKIGDSEFTVEELASEYGISKVILNRKLKALTGKTAKIFIRSIRLKRAAQLLSTGRYSVADVTYEVGFSDLKYFRTCFKTEFSISPSDFKKQHLNKEDDEAESENIE
ncbi:hybrid sensor histidine kinase/response regulator transcription factor [Labilibacter marinus]|uniref:hybrid sensor histidine kinase/response regulator transcription factor n=1 Tax=Labilibacter marinus TaxID=1477105 RepID=UPI00082A8EAE|nr:two-component regulator propeller domain-containing protein [Labilibacter marinus]